MLASLRLGVRRFAALHPGRPRLAAHGKKKKKKAEVSEWDKRKEDLISFLWRIRYFCERKGDTIISLSNVLQLYAFSFENPLYLQALMVAGNGCQALYFLTRMPVFWVPFGWAFSKTFVNAFQVGKILSDRQPVHFTSEELKVYEEHFMPFGVTEQQFKSFWDQGETRTLEPGELITREGEPLREVVLVTTGWVSRTRGGIRLSAFDSNKGGASDDGEDQSACAWIGEMTALRLVDSKIKTKQEALEEAKEAVKLTTSKDDDAPEGEVKTTPKGKLDAMGLLQGYGYGANEEKDIVSRQLQGVLGDEASAGALESVLSSDDLAAELGAGGADQYFTIAAQETTVIRAWNLTNIVDKCQKKPDMGVVFRKVCSQSVINKVKTLVSRQKADEKTSVSATEENIAIYETALKEVLQWDRAHPEDKVVLSRFRHKNGISESQHAACLKRAAGWTPDEYEHGAPASATGDGSKSRAAKALMDDL